MGIAILYCTRLGADAYLLAALAAACGRQARKDVRSTSYQRLTGIMQRLESSIASCDRVASGGVIVVSALCRARRVVSCVEAGARSEGVCGLTGGVRFLGRHAPRVR